MQWYVRNNCNNESDGSSASDCIEIPKEKKQKIQQKPMTSYFIPLMVRAHQHIQQASEIIFCDSTASLDIFTTFVFIISSCTTASGEPLAIILTSLEREEKICATFELVKKFLPTSTFCGRRQNCGPQIVMFVNISE